MPPGSPRQQTRQCSRCGTDFQYTVRRGRPNTFCSRACRTASRSSSAEPPDLTRYQQDLAVTAEDLQLAATTLLATAHDNGTTNVLMRQITEHYRLLMDVEAAVVARARAAGEPWMVIAEAAGSGPESFRKKWTQDKVTRRLALARETRHNRQTATSGPDTAAGPLLPAAQTPGEQFASAMTSLHRATGHTIKETASLVGISPSYVSRILSGTRRPAWPIVEKFAGVCQSNPAELRTLWEATQRTPDRDQEPVPKDPEEARRRFHTSLRALYLAAGRPTIWDIQHAASTGAKPAFQDIALTLNGSRIPDWETTTKIILALRGSPADLRLLWHAAKEVPLVSALPAAAFG
ncbi:helix-turn-helix domain-containing protein [Streptomyces cinereoruber]|uniref:helix-turn-helix domain-containing protein n=1 Tax=Streptomyces cinereoruber TaxID=67260 RepID=UPI00363A8D3C